MRRGRPSKAVAFDDQVANRAVGLTFTHAGPSGRTIPEPIFDSDQLPFGLVGPRVWDQFRRCSAVTAYNRREVVLSRRRKLAVITKLGEWSVVPQP